MSATSTHITYRKGDGGTTIKGTITWRMIDLQTQPYVVVCNDHTYSTQRPLAGSAGTQQPPSWGIRQHTTTAPARDPPAHNSRPPAGTGSAQPDDVLNCKMQVHLSGEDGWLDRWMDGWLCCNISMRLTGDCRADLISDIYRRILWMGNGGQCAV